MNVYPSEIGGLLGGRTKEREEGIEIPIRGGVGEILGFLFWGCGGVYLSILE